VTLGILAASAAAAACSGAGGGAGGVAGSPGGASDGALDAAVDAAGGAGGDATADAAAAEGGVAGLSAVKSVTAGMTHTCAVHRDGRVSCWGDGKVIGPGLAAVTAPVAIEVGGPAASVTAGVLASCALLEDATVRCWGDLGSGPGAARKIVKEDGAPLAGVTQITGGSLTFCAASAAGTYCWGDNLAGELARPVSMAFPPTTAVLAQAGARPVIAATVAILVHDGVSQLCGWGNNDSGIVPGARAILDRPSCAEMVPGVLQLSPGDGHVCARRGGAAFSCWGSNSGGQLGTGDEATLEAELPGKTLTMPSPITTIASGAYHVCALLETGAVMCWGSNDQGECGSPRSSPHFSPTAAAPLPARAVAIGSGAAAQHTCVVLENGTVACWGSNSDGQLGAPTDPAGSYSAVPVLVR
jgi:hypothetical protein